MVSKTDIVLVTGGTGFAGKVLVEQLCEIGCEVRVIARQSSNISAIENLSVKLIRGNVFDEAVVERACDGVNYVFHVAGAYREAKISNETYWNVHVKSTQLLVAQAAKQSNFKRFVHISTVGVHGHIKSPPADEQCEFSPGDVYQKTKLEAELWIRKFSDENSFPLTVVRPTAIYGPGDRRLLKLFKMAKLPVIPILGFTDGLYHLIHVEDFVSFLIIASASDKTLGQVYICGNKSSITIKSFVSVIANYMKKSPIYLRLPVTPFFIMGDVCETVCRYFSVEPIIYRRRVAFYTKDRSFNARKMLDDTGFKFKYDNETGIRITAQWYIDNKWL